MNCLVQSGCRGFAIPDVRVDPHVVGGVRRADRRREWDLVQLGPMVRESPVTEALLRVLGQARVPHEISSKYQSPYLTLPRTWDEVVESLSPSFRKTLRRKLNKAKKLDGLSVEETESPTRVTDAMEISLTPGNTPTARR